MDINQGIIRIYFTGFGNVLHTSDKYTHARDKQYQTSIESRRIWNKTPPVSGQRATERPLPLVISALRIPTLGFGKNGIPLYLPLFWHTVLKVLTGSCRLFFFLSFSEFTQVSFQDLERNGQSYINSFETSSLANEFLKRLLRVIVSF